MKIQIKKYSKKLLLEALNSQDISNIFEYLNKLKAAMKDAKVNPNQNIETIKTLISQRPSVLGPIDMAKYIGNEKAEPAASNTNTTSQTKPTQTIPEKKPGQFTLQDFKDINPAWTDKQIQQYVTAVRDRNKSGKAGDALEVAKKLHGWKPSLSLKEIGTLWFDYDANEQDKLEPAISLMNADNAKVDVPTTSPTQTTSTATSNGSDLDKHPFIKRIKAAVKRAYSEDPDKFIEKCLEKNPKATSALIGGLATACKHYNFTLDQATEYVEENGFSNNQSKLEKFATDNKIPFNAA
jgi:hypothetical protein